MKVNPNVFSVLGGTMLDARAIYNKIAWHEARHLSNSILKRFPITFGADSAAPKAKGFIAHVVGSDIFSSALSASRTVGEFFVDSPCLMYHSLPLDL